MLVQKVVLSKTMKIILIAAGGIIAVILVVFAYSKFLAPSSDDTETKGNAVVTPRSTIPTFDDSFLNDSRLYNFSTQNFSGFTDQIEGISLSELEPLPPTNVTVETPSSGRMVMVSWQLPEHINFSKVRVYRSESVNYLGDVVYSADVSTDDANKHQSYLDATVADRHVYFYRVRSMNTDNLESAIQEAVTAIPLDSIPPDSPADVQVKSIGTRQIEISWVNPINSDFAGIRVYRSISRGIIGTVIYDEGKGEASSTDPNRSIYVDQQIADNTPYYYTVTSVDNDGNESSTDLLSIPLRSSSYNPFSPISF